MNFIRKIDELTLTSLKIESFCKDKLISCATGFLIENSSKIYIVTNWHVVSGRNAETKKPLDKNAIIPDNLKVRFHSRNLGVCIEEKIDLYDNNEKSIWIEHPNGNDIDVVLIKINKDSLSKEIEYFYIDPIYSSQVDMVVNPSESVSIIGFPFGLNCSKVFPIWKTGHIASDIDLDLDEKRPAFLIDATTRGGMSGSPVFFKSSNYATSQGSVSIASGTSTRFLGVYSGRIHEDSEVGMVWKPFLIEEILSGTLIFNSHSKRSRP